MCFLYKKNFIAPIDVRIPLFFPLVSLCLRCAFIPATQCTRLGFSLTASTVNQQQIHKAAAFRFPVALGFDRSDLLAV